MRKVVKKQMKYILNLKLEAEKYEEDILAKRFEIGRKIYNDILNKTLKRYMEMTKSKNWRENQENIKEIYKKTMEKKQLKKELKLNIELRNELLKEYKLSEYSLHNEVKTIQHYYKNNIDSFTAQKIATRVWTAFEKCLYGNGEKVHFKKYEEGLTSLEGKSNKTGIRYNIETHILEWNKLKIKVQSKLNEYEKECLKSVIKYCRIKRKYVRGSYKYILQLILEGEKPVKQEYNTNGIVGIDIGTQTIAYTGKSEVKLIELAENVKKIENEKRILLRYMDRSRRKNNSDNFNEDGTIKRGKKLKWIYSKRYKKAKSELKDLYRKQADIRKQDHEKLSNEILREGIVIKVEKMNFKGLQRRAKETKVNEKTGKINKKKRYGKSLANKAPSMFLEILKNKVIAVNGKYIEVNTHKVKASQYNHLNNEYNKKKLSQRWNYFKYNNENIKVQRDLYSSFLIKNVREDLESIDDKLCDEEFEIFLKLHNNEIKRLSNNINVSSMG